MTTTAERIPLIIPRTGAQAPARDAVLSRAVTHRGLVRLHNEDSYCILANEKCHVFAVTDGLGGHRGGSIASEMAIDMVKNSFEKWNGNGKEKFVAKAVQTATVAAVDENSIAIAHVGDCRVYRVRQGKVTILTKDHSQAADLLRLRLISEKDAGQHHSRHQLTRSVGSSPFLRVDLIKEKISHGDSFILCSDGVWSELSPLDIRDALLDDNIEKSLEVIVGKVLKAGAPDNLTAIIFRAG
jgi:serine/threonine protein phosphatase PrpC